MSKKTDNPSGLITYSSGIDSPITKLLIQGIEYSTGRRDLENRYQRALKIFESGSPFWEAALEELQVKPEIEYESPLDKLREKNTPLIVIANHPYGLVDGLIAAKITSTLREDFGVLTNSVLCVDPRLDRYLIPINFSEEEGAARENVLSRKRALQILENGGGVVIFPGGGVATRKGVIGPLEELPWGSFVTKLITQTEADILPLYFYGENSRLFHLASSIHYSLRLSLFLYETKRVIGNTVRVTVRTPLPYSAVSDLSTRADLLEFLLRRTLGG